MISSSKIERRKAWEKRQRQIRKAGRPPDNFRKWRRVVMSEDVPIVDGGRKCSEFRRLYDEGGDWDKATQRNDLKFRDHDKREPLAEGEGIYWTDGSRFVHVTAKVDGFIGDGVVVQPFAVVESGAHVSELVHIGRDAVIERGASMCGFSNVFDGARVAEFTYVGSGTVVPSGTVARGHYL